MKREVLSILLVVLILGARGQSSLSIDSKQEKTRFFVVMNKQPMNDFYETNVTINNLKEGSHEIRIVFEADTVADIIKKITLNKNMRICLEIAEKSKNKKKISRTARSAGKKLNPGNYNSTFDYLVDWYYIIEKGEETFDKTGDDIDVNTDKSISTSILPVSKSSPGSK